MKDEIINFLSKNLERTYLRRKIKQYWKFLIFIIVGGYAYFIIHEFLHYFFITHFGNLAEFCWFCFPTRVNYITPLNEVLKNHYFISAVAPYVLSIILLFVLIISFLIFRRKFLFYIAIIPFLDTSINILAIPLAYFTKTGNDFLNLFKIGFYWGTLIIMISPIVLFLVLWLNYKKGSIKLKRR